MNLRNVAIVVVVVAGLAACGSDSASPAADATLAPVADGYQHPTGADEVVVSYVEAGGFTTREFAFQQTPNVLIAGDGRSFGPGAQIEIYPGPLLPAVQTQTVTEAGIQKVLAAADAAGLFAEVDYDAELNIADASTAVVTINVDGQTWVHEAYALGITGADGAESTPQRQALLDFVTQLDDLAALAGSGNLGESEIYDPTDYAIEAVVVDDPSAYGSDGIEPTIVDWPADVSVRLADASSCTVIAASEVGETLGAADQLTFFTDAGITYQVLARPVLPGGDC